MLATGKLEKLSSSFNTMSQISINVLKSRFQTNDRPSPQDFIDLIDTLAQIAPGGVGSEALEDGSVSPDKLTPGTNGFVMTTVAGEADWASPGGLAASAGGSELTGTYPTLLIKRHASDEASRPIIGNMVKTKTLPIRTLKGEDATANGSVPTFDSGTGDTTWQPPAPPGDEIVRNPVSGSVRLYTSANHVLAEGEDGTMVSYAHGLGAKPTFVNWVLVCITGHANYLAGDEIPISHAVDPAAPETPVFYPNDDATNIKCRIELTGGLGLRDKTSSSNTIVTFITADFAKFALKAYAVRLIAGDGFGSITEYTPANLAIPAENAAAVFAHGFGEEPSTYSVYLICTDAGGDLDYVVNSVLKIEQFLSVDGGNVVGQAFATFSNSTNIEIERLVGDIYLADHTSGEPDVIDPAKWEIRVRANKTINVPTKLFPALTFDIANPGGCISYGERLHVFHYGSNDARSFVSAIDLVTNRVRTPTIFTYSPYHWKFNPALFNFPTAAKKRVVWADTYGFQAVNVEDPSDVITFGTVTGYENYKPAWFNESTGGGSAAHPLVYSILSNGGPSNANIVTAVTMIKFTPTGSVYAAATLGTVNFTNVAIVNVAAFTAFVSSTAMLVMCQYNHPKKRIYLVENQTGFLHIFELSSEASIITFWPVFAGTPTYAHLTYVRAIAIPGAVSFSSDSVAENYAVDFDLDTGEEKAICFSRRGNQSLTGGVIRIPWQEG